MSSLPLISIAMTSYNREKYVDKAIESVLLQSYNNLELIIWDDGSDDSSPYLALKWASRDSRVKVYVSTHKGCGYALKSAFGQCTGKYIGCVDSDDYLLPNCLEKTVEVLEKNPNYGMVYTQYFEIDENDTIKRLGERCNYKYSKELLLFYFVTLHFRLIRKSAYKLAGGIDASYQAAIDYDLCLRLSEITNVYQLKEPLYCYRKHSDSITFSQRELQTQYAFMALAKALERRSQNNIKMEELF